MHLVAMCKLHKALERLAKRRELGPEQIGIVV